MNFRLTGTMGSAPDTRLFGIFEPCRRMTLPPFVSDLVLELGHQTPHSKIELQNFYHLGDFFVVSAAMKQFLEQHSGSVFESGRISVKQPGQELHKHFWAVKVQTRIDCINPVQSFARSPTSAPPAKSFSSLMRKLKLTDDLAAYYSNAPDNGYWSYPQWGVESVDVKVDAIPHDVYLFEPMFWPGYLVIEESFAKRLADECTGGSPGYYFWTVGLSNVEREQSALAQHLR